MCKSVNYLQAQHSSWHGIFGSFTADLKHSLPTVIWGTVGLGFHFFRILSSLGLDRIESKCSTWPIYVVLSPMKQAKISPMKPWSIIWYMAWCGRKYEKTNMRAGMIPDNNSQRMTCFFSWPFDWGCRQLFWRNFYSALSLDRMSQDNYRMDVNNSGGIHLFCHCVSFSFTVCKFEVSLHIIVQVFYT